MDAVSVVRLDVHLADAHSARKLEVRVRSVVLPGVRVGGGVVTLDPGDLVVLLVAQVARVDHGVHHGSPHTVSVDAEPVGTEGLHVRLDALVGGLLVHALPADCVDHLEWQSTPAVEVADLEAATVGLARLGKLDVVPGAVLVDAPLMGLVDPPLLTGVQVRPVPLFGVGNVEADVDRGVVIRHDERGLAGLDRLVEEHDHARVHGPLAENARPVVRRVDAVLQLLRVDIRLLGHELEDVVGKVVLLVGEPRRLQHGDADALPGLALDWVVPRLAHGRLRVRRVGDHEDPVIVRGRVVRERVDHGRVDTHSLVRDSEHATVDALEGVTLAASRGRAARAKLQAVEVPPGG